MFPRGGGPAGSLARSNKNQYYSPGAEGPQGSWHEAIRTNTLRRVQQRVVRDDWTAITLRLNRAKVYRTSLPLDSLLTGKIKEGKRKNIYQRYHYGYGHGGRNGHRARDATTRCFP